MATDYVFPAPAGMNRHGHLARVPNLGVPRASGDEPQRMHRATCATWCSPRQRG